MSHGLRTRPSVVQSGRKGLVFLASILLLAPLLSTGLAHGAVRLRVDGRGSPSLPQKGPAAWLAQSAGASSLTEAMKRAATLFGQADYTAAIALWTQVITSNPPTAVLNEALINRSKAYLILGQPSLALLDLQACRFAPNQTTALAELWLLQGSALLQNKQYAQAVSAFNTAEKLQPPNPVLLANRSVAHQSLGNMAAARADLQAAIRLQPNLSNYFNLAVLERLTANYASCYKLLSEIISKSQPYAKLFVQRGLCAAGLNQHDSAIADMLKALKLEPNNIDAIQQIGMSLVAKNQRDAAKQYLLRASSLLLANGQIEAYQKLLAVIASLERR